MKKDLLKVSIRQNAIYLPPVEGMGEKKKLTSTTVALVAQLRKMGYGCRKNCCIRSMKLLRLNKWKYFR